MNKVLLHICCGICAASAILRLQKEGFAVTGFFFNPNIHPAGEYQNRARNLSILRQLMKIDIVEGEYNPRQWFLKCKSLSARMKEEPDVYSVIRCGCRKL